MRWIRAAGALLLWWGCGGAQKEPAAITAVPEDDRARCDRIVERLRDVMPGDMGATVEEDVALCLELPPQMVACLADAQAKEAADACLDSYLGPPSPGDCEEAVAHLRTLEPGFAADADADIVSACVVEKTRAELSCIRDARSFAESQACERSPLGRR